jgi:hypothetical protein
LKAPDFPSGVGGSMPTPSLQDLWIESCLHSEAAAFVVKYHYTHSVKGMTPIYSYRVLDKKSKQVVGAAIFGIPAQIQTLNRYSNNGSIRLVELRRLVLLDAAPRNSESVVLSVMFRLLKKEGVQRILSYADPNEKRENHPDGAHTGLIYRATGFHLIKRAGTTKAIWWKGRRYPIRNIDQYNNYHLEPPWWDKIPDNKKILREEKYKNGKRQVWVAKIPRERILINQKLRAAMIKGEAELRIESGKIGYIKDLEKGMPYFNTPTPKQWTL